MATRQGALLSSGVVVTNAMIFDAVIVSGIVTAFLVAVLYLPMVKK